MASEEDKRKLDENMKFIQQREKDLQERVEQFDHQKERQNQVVRDVKEKESQLTSLTNEVNSKTKLLNLANQQLPIKEARNVELDKLIKEKEAKLKELEGMIEKKNTELNHEDKGTKKKFEEASLFIETLNHKLKDREEVIENYKKKIVALEFAQEDYKKREENLLLRVKELQEELRRQQSDLDSNYRKIVQIDDVGIQTDPVKIKTLNQDESDKLKKKLQIDHEREQLESKQKQMDEMMQELKQSQQKEKEAFLKQIRELQDYVSKQNQEINELINQKSVLTQQVADYAVNANNFNATANLELEIKYENELKESQKLREKINEMEPRFREQEVKLAQVEQKYNQMNIQSNEIKLQNEGITQKCDIQSQRIKEMKSQIKQLTSEKDDIDKEHQKKKQKLNLLQQQVTVFEEERHKKDAEIENKSKVLERMISANEDLKKENQKLGLKLRQIQTTQIKDMQKKLRDKDSELEVLKEMIRSAQLQNKGKDNEIQRMQKKINRMIKEGYVEKMQAYMGQRPNNNHLQQHHVSNHRGPTGAIDVEDLDIKMNDTQQTMDEIDDEEEGQDFYDNDGINNRDDDVEERAVRVKLMGKKDFILPDISQKSGSSQVNSMLENGLGNNRKSHKDLHHNVLFDQELDEQNISGNQLLKNKRKNLNFENNRVFESQYNKLVDDYQKNASQRQYKFSSIGVSGAMSNEPSPNIQQRRLIKGNPNYQSLDQLRGIGGQSDISSTSAQRQRQPKLINILEEKSDYLVISPPKFGRY
eukprot:403332543